jgi:hypothetical protein
MYSGMPWSKVGEGASLCVCQRGIWQTAMAKKVRGSKREMPLPVSIKARIMAVIALISDLSPGRP